MRGKHNMLTLAIQVRIHGGDKHVEACGHNPHVYGRKTRKLVYVTVRVIGQIAYSLKETPDDSRSMSRDGRSLVGWCQQQHATEIHNGAHR